MATTLFCTRCHSAQSVVFPFLETWPTKCEKCDRVVRWATASMLNRPREPWSLTQREARILKALWIDPEIQLEVVQR